MARVRKTFTYVEHDGYIELFLLGHRCGIYANKEEVERAKYNLLYN